jgi:uncharacterized membrane protein (TIGR02234 family)
MKARGYAICLIVLAVASVLVLLSYGATWVVATVAVLAGATGADDPLASVSLSGGDLAPLGGAMGWVGLAAVAALLATRSWGRRLTGVVVALAGAVAGVTALVFGLSHLATGGTGAFVETALDVRAPGEALDWDITAWWLPGTLGGLAMMVCGMLAIVVGPTWPGLSSRYSREDARIATTGAAPVDGAATLSGVATWDAIDRGEDPTLDRGGDAQPDSRAEPGSMGIDRD